MRQRLIRKLQNSVMQRSVNSLGNITPADMMEWLEVPDRVTKDFITYLHDLRIVAYKYRLKCSCGEMCTVYENKLLRQKNVSCEVCGHEFSMEYIKDSASIIYDIDKEALMEQGKDEVEFKIFPEPSNNIVPLPRKQEGKLMEIFMGSSSEATEFMYEIAEKLERLNASPLMWNAPGKDIFVPGTSTMDALIEITKRVQGAVFIFNADDKVWNNKSALDMDTKDAVRDNVLFEYGLFVGALQKEKVCFICKGKPWIASDLRGITYIDGDQGDAYVYLKLKDWVNAISK